jgi:hypothetical protein
LGVGVVGAGEEEVAIRGLRGMVMVEGGGTASLREEE